MKHRTYWSALMVGLVSMTSGCHCFHNCFHNAFPNVGWRLHQGGCPTCTPAFSSPAVTYRAPVVSSGPIVPGGAPCAGCAGGGGEFQGEIPLGVHQPVGYPPIAYPPVIGNPMPLPGAGAGPIPANELPKPMPVPSGPGN